VITEPVTFPAELRTRELLLTDEVVFRHEGGEVSVLLSPGLLLAANAIRAGEAFSLGYPGDTIGRIARADNGRISLHKDVAATVNAMIAFLDRFGSAVAEQVASNMRPDQGGIEAAQTEDGRADEVPAGENLPLPAA
jgi:hypothetical protein